MKRVSGGRPEPASEALRRAGLRFGPAETAGRIVSAVIAQAAALAPLTYFGRVADCIVKTIPAAAVGLGLLLAGIVAGQHARGLAAAQAERSPMPPGLAGGEAQAATLGAAAVGAADAMGIATILSVALIMLCVAAVFGLIIGATAPAACGVLKNIAAARYVDETLIEGQQVRFRGEEANTEVIGILATVLRTADTPVAVPNSLLQREMI